MVPSRETWCRNPKTNSFSQSRWPVSTSHCATTCDCTSEQKTLGRPAGSKKLLPKPNRGPFNACVDLKVLKFTSMVRVSDVTRAVWESGAKLISRHTSKGKAKSRDRWIALPNDTL